MAVISEVTLEGFGLYLINLSLEEAEIEAQNKSDQGSMRGVIKRLLFWSLFENKREQLRTDKLFRVEIRELQV